MLQSLLGGWALGLATGTTCLSTCAPIYIPYLIAEKRTGKQSLSIVLQITVGRFFSYAAFGAAFGFVGSKIPVTSREVFTGIAYILLSIYLVTSVFRIKKHSENCRNAKFMKLTTNPFILGILTGISFCPAFLIAISNAIEISGVVGGVTLFIGFFLGTSIFILPITFLGALSNMKNLRKIAQIVSIIIAAFFIYKGTNSVIHYLTHVNQEQIELDENQVAEPFTKSGRIWIFTDTDKSKWDDLILILEEDSAKVTFFDTGKFDLIPGKSSIITTIKESSKIPEDIGQRVIKIDINNFDNYSDFEKLKDFLNKIYFRYDPSKGYSFKVEQPPGGLVN